MRAARVLVVLAGLPVLLLLIAELSGWRPCVGVIAGGGGACSDAGAGAAYALAWFASIVATPVLGLGAALSAALDRALRPKDAVGRG